MSQLRLHPQLYEINAWAWLDGLSRQLGRQVTLGSVPDAEWERLQELGFDLVYLMGVWKRSERGRQIARTETGWFRDYDTALSGWRLEDVVGSPYSIQAYEPAPHIGTTAELKQLRENLDARGMRLVVDFVPNHTGQDHRWTREHPEYYIQGTIEQYRAKPADYFLAECADGSARYLACGRDPYFPAWPDTAQLNYFDPGCRAAMLQQLRDIAAVADGVRCDMAMLLLNDHFHATWAAALGSTPVPAREFWDEATEALPQLIWIAEAYSDSEWSLQQLGFNFTYDKRLYDRLRDSFARDVYLHLKADAEYQRRSVRFLENHDEPRAAAVFGDERSPAVPLLAATIPGMHFFHDGQFEGKKVKLPVMLARAKEEAADEGCRAVYEKILRLADAEEFHTADWQLLDVHSAGDDSYKDLIAYLWRGEHGNRIVVVNLSFNHSSGRVNLPQAMLAPDQLQLDDLLNQKWYERESAEIRAEGLFVMLDAYGGHVFSVSAVEMAASAGA